MASLVHSSHAAVCVGMHCVWNRLRWVDIAQCAMMTVNWHRLETANPTENEQREKNYDQSIRNNISRSVRGWKDCQLDRTARSPVAAWPPQPSLGCLIVAPMFA